MGFYGRHVFPRIMNHFMGQAELADLRRETMRELSGTVLEIGYGTGLNEPFYPDAVERVIALDPMLEEGHPSRALRAKNRARTGEPRAKIELRAGMAEDTGLPDRSVDAVLCTWTLCSVRDPARALSEVRRVLRPGGAMFFVEHGIAWEPRWAKVQRFFEPVQRRLAGNCHLRRDPEALLRAAGFDVELERLIVEGPKTEAFTYRGVARA